MILVYVDDLFITSKDEEVLTFIADTLKKKYGGVSANTGLQHNFLGIHWDFKEQGQVTLSMDGYVKDVIRKYNVVKRCTTPATDNLFKSDPTSPKLSAKKQEESHSVIMTLHYLVKRVRGDILTSVSFCATRVLCTTEEDEKMVDGILSYLLYTQDQHLILKICRETQPRVFVDASFGISSSATGVVIILGDSVIYIKSRKQKVVTRSSTEAELVGISDALSPVLWTREYLISSGLSLGPAVIFQDNQSTIYLAKKGRATSERSRHIKIRHFFVSHYIESKEIDVRYLPTGDMVADILTKPLHGALFEKFCRSLTGQHTEHSRHPAQFSAPGNPD